MVTFLFTDTERSTRLLADVGDERYGELLEQHRALLREACARHGGYDFGGAGDAMFVAFNSAHDALRGTFAAQCPLIDHPWPADRAVRVRMGLHTRETTTAAGDYVRIGVHRASPICDRPSSASTNSRRSRRRSTRRARPSSHSRVQAVPARRASR